MEYCKRGHAWSPENTRTNAQGKRFCRACLRILDAKYSRQRGVPLRCAVPPIERFIEHILLHNGGCWEWTGNRIVRDYGILFDGTKHVQAHRWYYAYVHGPISPKLELDHLCRNHWCVNPDHLEPVTHKVNVLRGNSPYAINARKTHCSKGHEFTPENTFIRNSRRGCKTCIRANGLRSYYKNKCQHEQTKDGRCTRCLRKVVTRITHKEN